MEATFEITSLKKRERWGLLDGVSVYWKIAIHITVYCFKQGSFVSSLAWCLLQTQFSYDSIVYLCA